jgi:hypothetical protein
LEVRRSGVFQVPADRILTCDSCDLFLAGGAGPAYHLRKLLGRHRGALAAARHQRVFEASVPCPEKRRQQYRRGGTPPNQQFSSEGASPKDEPTLLRCIGHP